MFRLRNLFLLSLMLTSVSVMCAQVRFYRDERQCTGRAGLERNLLNAVNEDSESAVRQILLKDGEARMTDDCGISILTYATAASRPKIMRLLIGAGADVNASDDSIYKLPLAWAINSTDPEDRYTVAKILIDSGANVNMGNGSTPLMEAVSKGDVRLVELLLAFGADVNLHDDDANNAYSVAAILGDQKLKRILLEAGADPTVGVARYRKDWGPHAFFQAAADGRVDVVEAMLSNGMATVNMTNARKVTALMRAHDKAMVEALLNAGADINLQDDRGFTALMWAAEIGRVGIVKKLIAAGADVNLRRNDGKATIDIVDDCEIQNLLKEAGAIRQESSR